MAPPSAAGSVGWCRYDFVAHFHEIDGDSLVDGHQVAMGAELDEGLPAYRFVPPPRAVAEGGAALNAFVESPLPPPLAEWVSVRDAAITCAAARIASDLLKVDATDAVQPVAPPLCTSSTFLLPDAEALAHQHAAAAVGAAHKSRVLTIRPPETLEVGPFLACVGPTSTLGLHGAGDKKTTVAAASRAGRSYPAMALLWNVSVVGCTFILPDVFSRGMLRRVAIFSLLVPCGWWAPAAAALPKANAGRGGGPIPSEFGPVLEPCISVAACADRNVDGARVILKFPEVAAPGSRLPLSITITAAPSLSSPAAVSNVAAPLGPASECGAASTADDSVSLDTRQPSCPGTAFAHWLHDAHYSVAVFDDASRLLQRLDSELPRRARATFPRPAKAHLLARLTNRVGAVASAGRHLGVPAATDGTRTNAPESSSGASVPNTSFGAAETCGGARSTEAGTTKSSERLEILLTYARSHTAHMPSSKATAAILRCVASWAAAMMNASTDPSAPLSPEDITEDPNFAEERVGLGYLGPCGGAAFAAPFRASGVLPPTARVASATAEAARSIRRCAKAMAAEAAALYMDESRRAFRHAARALQDATAGMDALAEGDPAAYELAERRSRLEDAVAGFLWGLPLAIAPAPSTEAAHAEYRQWVGSLDVRWLIHRGHPATAAAPFRVREFGVLCPAMWRGWTAGNALPAAAPWPTPQHPDVLETRARDASYPFSVAAFELAARPGAAAAGDTQTVRPVPQLVRGTAKVKATEAEAPPTAPTLPLPPRALVHVLMDASLVPRGTHVPAAAAPISTDSGKLSILGRISRLFS